MAEINIERATKGASTICELLAGFSLTDGTAAITWAVLGQVDGDMKRFEKLLADMYVVAHHTTLLNITDPVLQELFKPKQQ